MNDSTAERGVRGPSLARPTVTVDPQLLRDAINGDPLAAALVAIHDRMDAVEQRRVDPISEEGLRHISYEAAAGARTEVRKLVEIETERRWYRSALLALAAFVLGYAACWLAGHGYLR